MVRPHSQSFVYDEHDVTTMLDDISFIRESGAAGIVLGTLTDDAKVDTKTLEVLLQAAGSMNVTYHRAFDEIADQHEALQVLSAYPQINRILTSAGPRSALQSVEEMKALVHASAHTQITILAGAGLTVPGLAAFVEHTGVKEVHFGSALRKDGQYLRPIEPEKVQAAAKIIASFER
ncbi:cytoplasmic copper homeostasis protein cutC [Paenibacillus pini JCM 16418]|uniref:Copper homeostasis protein cutC homolog n=1 Tax=Paenibacillus pini JCM 16418 TaxID=1236976 RepID=W7YFH2_9BACL|nr:cytoplasmic copper homeostasis protein cutC [Paenibacillus pini JCM 16418]